MSKLSDVFGGKEIREYHLMNEAETFDTAGSVINVPNHVAITPDGNRRWAEQHGVSSLEGHYAGAEVIKRIIRHAADKNVQYVSIWGMSLDNLVKRNPSEVFGLLRMFRKEFRALASDEDIHNRKVHINVIGKWKEKFPSPVRSAIQDSVDATRDYSNLFLNVFLAYSGTDEMLDAVRKIAQKAKHASLDITPSVIKQHLLTRDLPAVDLLIRTGGEPHLSAGFMMWDVADAQLYFTKKYWPDFSNDDFDAALAEYAQRDRRYGK